MRPYLIEGADQRLDAGVQLEKLYEYEFALNSLLVWYYDKLDREVLKPDRRQWIQSRWQEMLALREDALSHNNEPSRSFQLTPKESEVAASLLIQGEEYFIEDHSNHEVGCEIYKTLRDGHMAAIATVDDLELEPSRA